MLLPGVTASKFWGYQHYCGYFSLGRLLFHDWKWPIQLTLMKGLYLILTGAGIAIVIEITALAAGRWAYTSLMLVIPALNIGLVPVAQFVVLPYVSYIFSLRVLFKARKRT